MAILALNLVTRIKLGRHTWCAKHAPRLCVGGPMTGGVGALSRARPGGGGGYPPPPLRFVVDSEKTAARSAAKFAIAIQPTIWHISKRTMTRWHQRSRLQVTLSDPTSSCVFRSLTSCQRHTSDPNSLKLAVYSKDIGVYNLYISDFWYRCP